jgi:hypothetical protein
MAVSRKNVRVCQVKYLTAYYDLLLAVDTLDEVDGILQEWALDKWGVALSLPEALIYNKDITEVITSLDIDNFAYEAGAVSAYMDMPRYAGISGTLPTYPTTLVGGFYVMPACTAFLYSLPVFAGTFGEFNIASSNLTLTAGLNFIGIRYNSGSPEWVLYSAETSFDYSSIIPAICVLLIGTTPYVIPYGQMGCGLPEKLIQNQKNRLSHDIITEFTLGHSTMYIELSALTVNNGTSDVSCLIYDSEDVGNTLIQYYKDAMSVWTPATITQLDSSQYQSAAGLAALAPGEYVINYVFRVIDATQKLCFMVLSNKFASLAAAKESEMLTDLPEVIKKTSVLVGRFILAASSTTPVVQKVQKPVFGTVA